jgi:Zn-dependent protease with chaperone function
MSTFPSDTGQQLAAAYYDGRTAASVAVMLSVEDGDLVLRGANIELHWPLDEVRISERLGNTPRLISFAGGGHCEVTDHAGLDALLASLGRRKGWLDALQHSMRWALASVLLLLITFAAGYRYLLPWGAEVLAARMPESALHRISKSTLDFLNRATLEPSKLSAGRQQEIEQSFAGFVSGSENVPHYRILFRRSEAMGANAFALPDGTIVLLDGLVDLTQDDNEIDAVLAHELGHVQNRHGVRLLLQSSAVGLVLAWYVGDVSSLLAGAPTLLLQAKFSRDMESEADNYAEQLLQRNKLSGCVLAGMLDKLESSRRKINSARGQGGKTAEAGDYLSSHPATRERMRQLCPASQ